MKVIPESVADFHLLLKCSSCWTIDFWRILSSCNVVLSIFILFSLIAKRHGLGFKIGNFNVLIVVPEINTCLSLLNFKTLNHIRRVRSWLQNFKSYWEGWQFTHMCKVFAWLHHLSCIISLRGEVWSHIQN